MFLFVPRDLYCDAVFDVNIDSREMVVPGALFDLNVVGDIIESTVAVGTFISSFVYKEFFYESEWDGTVFDLNTVNAFDRWSAHPYNDSLHKLSNVTCMINLALVPMVFFGTELLIGNADMKNVLVLTKLYGDAFLFSYGVKNWINVAVRRYRPYMYFENPNYKEISNGEFEWAFPSGHTKAAFMTATFMHYTLCQYYPDSVWKWPVIGVSYAVASLTGVLRVMSGCHFFSDVLVGAVIGATCGVVFPLMHRNGTPSVGQNAAQRSEGRAAAVFNRQPILGLTLAL